MDQRQEMMDDVMDDAMDVGADEEGEEVVEQVLEEIGVDLTSAVSTRDRSMMETHWLTRCVRSSEKHRLECRRRRFRRAELLKRLAEVEVGIPATTPSRPALTAFDGSRSDNAGRNGRKGLGAATMDDGESRAASLFCHIRNGVPGKWEGALFPQAGVSSHAATIRMDVSVGGE
ncbi:charged multivesicular body protein 2a [Colletotrichum higginsianum]|uniref:Charged multivesicular body protein 2a n=1 Tax=Colletotrichum higginsianum (strain IMI 349063) TaxID=759273 RepID=H1W3N8_COLHI|nr:charged multivesicular body protein 2a [Colletotrichum higginsianum]